jgi:nicotinate-nucleotide pyrophosphorylase (carboxylating)
VREAVRVALAEDLTPLGDVSAALVDPSHGARGVLASRAAGRLAGSACVTETYRQVDAAVSLEWLVPDGGEVGPGTVVARVEGPLRSVLTGERTALNFLGHLSGVATLAARYRAAADGPTLVWDTRKTTPGLRALEKAAVRAGGCVNHRGNLSEWVMLKDNHLTGTTITEAVTRARAWWPGRTVQVECDRVEQVAEAVTAGADAVLLDNMDPATAARAVAVAREGDHRVLVEISGGVTLDTIGTYSRLGADCISVGAITASAPSLDLGLDLEPGA